MIDADFRRHFKVAVDGRRPPRPECGLKRLHPTRGVLGAALIVRAEVQPSAIQDAEEAVFHVETPAAEHPPRPHRERRELLDDGVNLRARFVRRHGRGLPQQEDLDIGRGVREPARGLAREESGADIALELADAGAEEVRGCAGRREEQADDFIDGALALVARRRVQGLAGAEGRCLKPRLVAAGIVPEA